jgi:hypothetical protein
MSATSVLALLALVLAGCAQTIRLRPGDCVVIPEPGQVLVAGAGLPAPRCRGERDRVRPAGMRMMARADLEALGG